MSGTLPGSHLCIKHQGNHSHYAESNCEVCRGIAALQLLHEIEVAAVVIDGQERTNYDLTNRIRIFRAAHPIPSRREPPRD